MKKFTLHIVLLIGAFIISMPKEVNAQNDNKNEPVLWTAEDVKWAPIPGGTSGAMNARLWGDETKGAHGGLTKFPAGFKAPLHHHSNDIRIVVVKGAYIYNGKKYGPGSYLFIPGGTNHESGGAEDSESIFFTDQPGPFDIKPVEASK